MVQTALAHRISVRILVSQTSEVYTQTEKAYKMGLLQNTQQLPGKSPWLPRAVLVVVCALVIGLYVGAAHPGLWESLSPRAADNYYNLLVQGFQAGQLELEKGRASWTPRSSRIHTTRSPTNIIGVRPIGCTI